MYSRYDAHRDTPIRLPEHYSGTAFSGRTSSEYPDAHRVEIAKPSPLGPSNFVAPPPQKEPQEHSLPTVIPPLHEERKEPSAAISSILPSSPLHVGFPFLHGIGFDELLILGLILLLSHTDEQSDVVLWLALLLFCG